VAVEVNKRVVSHRRHGEHALAEGDVVEIVTLVGGG
jgi:sulfur carrier protein